VPGGALLLAAGVSRRFGADKRNHRLSSGETLLQATTARYVHCFEQVVVVLRAEDAAVERALTARFDPEAVRTVNAADSRLGMGHSLAAGIKTITDWAYAFIALADMPFVQTATLELLKQTMEGAAGDTIVQPTLHGKAGHPVGFGRDQFQALTTLTGDSGARSVVSAQGGHVVAVPVTDPGVLRDIDQLRDL
jgi:molybdenum cofactor cytidylyltransferase